MGIGIAAWQPVMAQGMRSATDPATPLPAPAAEPAPAPEPAVSGDRQVATVQRLLRRLGYLNDADMTRQMDNMTKFATTLFLADIKRPPDVPDTDTLMKLLFSTAWAKEGWGSGTAQGQELVVEPGKVRAAQEALAKLNYEPGPTDGVFGPATLSSVELFQEDNGMRVDGLLTRNTHEAILRGLVLLGQTPKAEVRILNWPDYVDPAVLETFERETKIKVVHEVFESSDETKELLLAHSSKYDIIVQPGYQLRPVLEKEGLVQILDKTRLSNVGNLDPEALRLTGDLDPGNQHSVPYMWGTVGIGVNEDAVRKLASAAKPDSLAMFLDPALAKPLSSCGLAFVDEPTDVLPALVAYVGGDPRKIGIADLEAIDQALTRVAPYVTVVPADRFIDEVSQGKYCAAIGYSGDVFLARDGAAEAKKGKISYYVPAEGSQLWFDLLVIPAAARNVDAAYAFLDFLLKPEIAAANTNHVQYANANTASAPFIDKALLSNPGLYPPADVLQRLAVLSPLSPNVEAELQRIWAKLKK
ncbi:MAG: extracellular solute-binding protein [Pseudomonadota bacterium]|nr:extracellular solute-binding protein [Pseudomonadota bacterium]